MVWKTRHIILYSEKNEKEIAKLKIGKSKGAHYFAQGSLSAAIVLVKNSETAKFDIKLADLTEKHNK